MEKERFDNKEVTEASAQKDAEKALQDDAAHQGHEDSLNSIDSFDGDTDKQDTPYDPEKRATETASEEKNKDPHEAHAQMLESTDNVQGTEKADNAPERRADEKSDTVVDSHQEHADRLSSIGSIGDDFDDRKAEPEKQSDNIEAHNTEAKGFEADNDTRFSDKQPVEIKENETTVGRAESDAPDIKEKSEVSSDSKPPEPPNDTNPDGSPKRFEDYTYSELQDMARDNPEFVTKLNEDFRERYEAEIRDMSVDEYRDYKIHINDNSFQEESTKESKNVDSAVDKTSIYSDVNYSSLTPEIVKKLRTEPDTAYFWSGRTDGVGGVDVAKEIATSNQGVTLESVIESQGIELKPWDFDDPESVKQWEEASDAYASQVKGEVHAVVGNNLREGNIWENVELPKLKENPDVTKITVIDPKSLEENVIFERNSNYENNRH